MRTNAIGYLVLAIILVLAAMQAAYYGPRLPPLVATHFDLNGKPNGWAAPRQIMELHAIIMLLLVGMVVLLRFVLPFIPSALINLPHKDYWLAPTRKAETDAAVFRSLLWCMNATALFLTGVMELVYRFNLGNPQAMRWGTWALLGGYFLLLAIILIAFYRRFARVPDATAASS